MAETTGLAESYLAAQKVLLDMIINNAGSSTAGTIQAYAEAYRALAEHSPKAPTAHIP